MATVSLYVNGNDTIGKWIRVGTAPYLNAQDQPVNYVYSAGRNEISDTFQFADTALSGKINSVKLYIHAYGVAPTNFTSIVSGIDTGLGCPTSWGWVNVDVSGILTSWDLINLATVLFDRPNTTNLAGVDCAYLLVDYTAEANVFIAGIINGVSSTENKVVVDRNIKGIINGVSVADNKLSVDRNIVGTINGIASTSGKLSVDRNIAGIINAVSQADNILKVDRNIKGTINAISGTENIIIINRGIKGLIQGVSSIDNKIIVDREICGIINGISQTYCNITLMGGEDIKKKFIVMFKGRGKE